jgi:TorA maturation chaperone TorD
MEAAPIAVQHRLDPEDRARANFYAILAALFADAPDAKLLAAVGATDLLEDAEAGDLPLAWNRLVAACRVMDPEAARQEHTDLFVGTGRTEVNLHGSHWRSGFMMEKPLVELRRDLTALGLARKPESTQVEDHISALFETMRLLIEGDSTRPPANLSVQKGFFATHIGTWVFDLCAALKNCSLANFYRPVAEFAELFMALERDSLAIE